MFRRILVPLDGSVLSEGVLLPVRRLVARQGGTQVELLYVVEEDADADASARGRTYLADMRKLLASEAGLESSATVDRGPAAERILSQVELRRPDLVAMATHGRTGVQRLVRGSVAEEVLRHCRAPVLMVNPQGVNLSTEAKALTVLVPLDGSPLADKVLDDVVSLANGFGASVVLLQVESSARDRPVVQRAMDSERIERVLRPQQRRLGKAGLSVEVATAFGKPAEQILDVAKQRRVDLVAMSTHGRGGVSRLRFGSVAESVLRECTCPVLVRRG